MTMKPALIVALFSFSCVFVDASTVNPLQQVNKLLGELKATVTADQSAEAEAYRRYSNYCETTNTSLGANQIVASESVQTLTAKIDELKATIEGHKTLLAQDGATIARVEAEYKESQKIRAEEQATFEKNEKELSDSIDMLARAESVLKREMDKNPAVLAQIDNMTSVNGMMQTIGLVVEAAGLSVEDHQHLVALMQASQDDSGTQSDSDDDGDDSKVQPVVAAYKTQSGRIANLILSLKENADELLRNITSKNNLEAHLVNLMVNNATNFIKEKEKEMELIKKELAKDASEKAEKESELAVDSKDLATTTKTIETLTQDCEQKKVDHDASVHGFTTELAALTKAQTDLEEKATGAETQTYSFLQLQSHTHDRLNAQEASTQVINLIKQVAREYHSSALFQLSSQINTVFRLSSGDGEDPFRRVRGLVKDLINKLELQVQSESDEKAFCDSEMKLNQKKVAQIQENYDDKATFLDSNLAEVAELKEKCAELGGQIATMTSRSTELNSMRNQEAADFAQAKKDLNDGILGVQGALRTLKDYYSSQAPMEEPEPIEPPTPEAPPEPKVHVKSGSAAAPIFDMLEVCEADFQRDLSEKTATEDDAIKEFEAEDSQLQIDISEKEQLRMFEETKYKTIEREITGLTQDRDSAKVQLDAALEYQKEVKAGCTELPETYASRKARKEAEITGLEKAKEILETAFPSLIQQGSRKRSSHGFLGYWQ